LTVSLERLAVTDATGFQATFTLDEYRRESLLKGLDEIGRTLLLGPQIAAYERRRASLIARIEG
jgi:3-isopropylmalate/(R)-2-methylmalate dehydratase small subunit